jgi:hypothetical protein
MHQNNTKIALHPKDDRTSRRETKQETNYHTTSFSSTPDNSVTDFFISRKVQQTEDPSLFALTIIFITIITLL